MSNSLQKDDLPIPPEKFKQLLRRAEAAEALLSKLQKENGQLYRDNLRLIDDNKNLKIKNKTK